MVETFHYGSMNVTRLMMEPSAVMELRQTLASYMGHFKHADTFNLINSMISQNDWLLEYFVFHKGRLIERFRRKEAFRSMKTQIDFLRNRLNKTILFVKVGAYIELYDEDALSVGRRLGLSVTKARKRMGAVAGFPARFEGRFLRRALSFGTDLAVIDEGLSGKFIKDRYFREIYRVLPIN